VKDVPIDVDGFTSVELYVGDYAASATLAITIDGGATYTVKIPRTKATGDHPLPEVGWIPSGQTTAYVPSPGQSVVADSDSIPFSAMYGDGLSVFEEYRGFVVAGTHLRLSPVHKDVFVDADPEISTLMFAKPALQSLPLRVHFIAPGESKGEDLPIRSITRAKPVINPNRSGLPSARPVDGQRGVRLIYQRDFLPAVCDYPARIDYCQPVNRIGLFGVAWPDGYEDYEIFNGPVNTGGPGSPNTIQFIEVYPASFESQAVIIDFSTAVPMTKDGQAVGVCQYGDTHPCDDWDTEYNIVTADVIDFIQGEPVFALDTAPAEEDSSQRYTLQTWTCTSLYNRGGISEEEMDKGRTANVVHEFLHSLSVKHGSLCGALMFQNFMATSPYTITPIDAEILQIEVR
jgi:hypothetical protein